MANWAGEICLRTGRRTRFWINGLCVCYSSAQTAPLLPDCARREPLLDRL